MPSDPFEMALVHRAFRRELGNATDLVRNTSVGDTSRSAVVGGHIEFMLTAIHHHHLAEDAQVWPRLSAKAPSRTVEVHRMQSDHRDISDASERVRDTATRWADTADRALADQLVAHIEEYIRRIDEHFDDEERNVVPLIAEYLTPGQWRKFLAHGSAFVRAHPRRGLAFGAMVLDGQSAEDRRRFLGNVPLPVRTVFKLVGDRVYAAYRAEVYGAHQAQ
jgi:hemerythrin-like domain-containing protein